VHRIGRTGRAGKEGCAVSLVCVDEKHLLGDIERLLKRDLPKVIVPGYEPDPSIRPEPIKQRGGGRSGGRPNGRSGSGQSRDRSPRSGQGRSGDGNRSGSGGRRRQGQGASSRRA
jgi:ATP-dependent RNA helicase RhlE